MPKARKRKVPITTSSDVPSSTSSSKPESSRLVIRQFHVLLKQQAQLQRLLPSDPSKRKELEDVERKIEELGGLESYQRMSAIGQGNDRGGGSEKVFIGWLKERGVHERVVGSRTEHGDSGKLKDVSEHFVVPVNTSNSKKRLLEVGALKPDNYSSCSAWIHNTPMDLNSRHPTILEQDFLLLDEEENQGKWDLISLSLVLNFVPEAVDRGRMLNLAHKFLRTEGYLFVALPLPCLSNSRYLDFEKMHEIMTYLGFQEIQQKWKKGGKMVYFLYQKVEQGKTPPTTRKQVVPLHLTKKAILRQGNRNNFAILL
ncbi:nucleolus protein [Dendrothele bispora CBS 962.96]|uniref:25S rRNA adenine-N(1) methyltransferase n=1 Tax=Dendrothele bispora (strain CBS 962.96) TaxID=1314807 RepID=A0A4S8MY19_DENBC|nr:nucleolus protein [Dendrothele bispora CBS 962.96]